jgi:hypothetical protein
VTFQPVNIALPIYQFPNLRQKYVVDGRGGGAGGGCDGGGSCGDGSGGAGGWLFIIGNIYILCIILYGGFDLDNFD